MLSIGQATVEKHATTAEALARVKDLRFSGYTITVSMTRACVCFMAYPPGENEAEPSDKTFRIECHEELGLEHVKAAFHDERLKLKAGDVFRFVDGDEFQVIRKEA